MKLMKNIGIFFDHIQWGQSVFNKFKNEVPTEWINSEERDEINKVYKLKYGINENENENLNLIIMEKATDCGKEVPRHDFDEIYIEDTVSYDIKRKLLSIVAGKVFVLSMLDLIWFKEDDEE